MNNNSTDIIKRQLLIIKLLLEGNYVSTRQIQEHLLKSGIETKLRSLQRDLAALEEILPIECRKDDKPYSWRWQRLATTSEHQLSLSQAIALRLVETELRGIIPEDLYDRLEPLFIKSHFVTGLSQLTALDNWDDSLQRDLPDSFINHDRSKFNYYQRPSVTSISTLKRLMMLMYAKRQQQKITKKLVVPQLRPLDLKQLEGQLMLQEESTEKLLKDLVLTLVRHDLEIVTELLTDKNF